MSFTEAISAGFKNYANFQGRTQRSGFWFFVLFLFICNLVLGFIDSLLFGGTVFGLQTIFALATLLPAIAVNVRRLHDIDRTGWWVLLAFVPLLGAIVLIIFACIKGTGGDNRFGPDPLAGPAPDSAAA